MDLGIGPPSGWSKYQRSASTWRHLVFSFHDSLLECILRDVQVSIVRGSVRGALIQAVHSMDQGEAT